MRKQNNKINTTQDTSPQIQFVSSPETVSKDKKKKNGEHTPTLGSGDFPE